MSKTLNYFQSNINSGILSVLLFLAMFSSFFGLFGVVIFGYIDEALLLLGCFWFLLIAFYRLKIEKLHFLIFLSVIILFIISLHGRNFNIVNVFIQNFVHLKFFIVTAILFSVVRQDKIYLKNLFMTIFIFTIFGLIVNFVFVNQYYEIIDQEPQFRINGIPRMIGFQLQSNFLGYTLAVFFAYFILFDIKKTTLKRIAIMSVVFIVLIFLSGSRSSLIIFPIVLAIFFNSKNIAHSVKLYYLVLLAVIGVGVIFLSYDTLSLLTDKTMSNFGAFGEIGDSKYIRAIMIYYGIVLAIENFPAGVGSASFGSMLSQGSVIYDDLGIGWMSFFKEWHGVYDSNFASIIGEFGMIGIIIYSGLIYKIYRLSINNSMNKKPYILAIVFFLVMISVVAPVFTHAYTVGLFSLALVITKANKTNSDNSFLKINTTKDL